MTRCICGIFSPSWAFEASFYEVTFDWRPLREERMTKPLQLGDRWPRIPPFQTGLNIKLLKTSSNRRRWLIDERENRCWNQKYVSKYDRSPKLVAKGRRGMQAVSNLTLSAELGYEPWWAATGSFWTNCWIWKLGSNQLWKEFRSQIFVSASMRTMFLRIGLDLWSL